MARYISKYRRYKVTPRQHQSQTLGTGKELVSQYGVIAEFQHGGVLPSEQELARKTFKVRGATQEEDEVTPVDPFSGPGNRLSTYDTDAPHLVRQWETWDGFEGNPPGTIKREVEEFLDTYHQHGRDYIKVEKAVVAAPWPAYDKLVVHGARKIEHVVEKIVAAVAELGIDPEAVLAYERQEKNRPEVIAAVETLLAPTPEDTEELVAA